MAGPLLRRWPTLLLLPLLTLAGGAAAQRPEWPHERQAGGFHCHATCSLERLGPVLQDLAALQQDLVRQLGVPAAEQPSHVFLLHDRAFYEKYVGRHFPDVSLRQALFIKSPHGPGMIFAYQHRELEGDLRHESTHALLHAVLPMVPLWLDEGLAEYFETPPRLRPRGSPHLRSVKWDARLGRTPSLRGLESLGKMEEMRASDYRDAWAWVHFMLHGPPVAGAELRAYLADIAAHSPPGRLSERLRRRVADLDRAYLAHFRRWR